MVQRKKKELSFLRQKQCLKGDGRIPSPWADPSRPAFCSVPMFNFPHPTQAPGHCGSLYSSLPLSASVAPLGLPHSFVPTLVWATGVSCLATCSRLYSGPHTSPLIILSLHSSDTILLKCQGLVTPSPEADHRSLRIKDEVRPSEA